MKKKWEKKLIFIENLIDNEGNWLIIKKILCFILYGDLIYIWWKFYFMDDDNVFIWLYVVFLWSVN